jgi:hypothetical protein
MEEECESAGNGTVVETKERQEEELKTESKESNPDSKCGLQD